MASVRSGEESIAVVPLGIAGEADSGIWWVENELGAVLSDPAVVPGSAFLPGAFELVIPAELNTLPEGKALGHRIIRVRFRALDDFNGEREAETDYQVTGTDQKLVVQVNSFLGYNEAVAMAATMPEIPTFRAADRAARVGGLSSAWHTMVRLRYEILLEPTEKFRRVVDFPGASPGFLLDLTAEELQSLDPRFLTALKRAQLVEADVRLGTPPQGGRLDGVVQTTAGESSMTFRAGKPMDFGVSARTMRELRGYLSMAVRLGRSA